jgi:hypothetical protein
MLSDNILFYFVKYAFRLPRKIQILDENGENIVLMTNEDDDSDDSDDEDREFTVIVEDDEGEG